MLKSQHDPLCKYIWNITSCISFITKIAVLAKWKQWLSVEEVITGVLNSGNEDDISSLDDSMEKVGDFEDSGNVQEIFIQINQPYSVVDPANHPNMKQQLPLNLNLRMKK